MSPDTAHTAATGETPAIPGPRQPPVVIVVPPRPGGTIPAWTPAVLVGMVVGPLLLGAIFAPAKWTAFLIIGALIVTAVGTTISICLAWAVRRERRRIDAFLSASKHDFDSPLQRELSRCWSGFTTFTPKVGRIRETLTAHGMMQPGRATVLVFDTMEPREANPYSFEPVILTPTQRMGQQVSMIVICLVVIGVSVLARAVNSRLAFDWWRVPHIYLLGVLAGWQWYKLAVAAPEYIRLAPGVIQFVRFERGRSKPAIRSYELGEGMLLCFLRFGSKRVLTIERVSPRGGEIIPLSDMFRSRSVEEDFWRAILSTAPTPPLSEEDLIG